MSAEMQRQLDFDILRARVEEHEGRIELVKEQLRTSSDLLDQLDEDTRAVTIEIANTYESSTGLLIDCTWVNAMLEANVPVNLILKAWDIKDESSRARKDYQRPSET